MNMTNVLLGSTGLVLAAALLLSFKRMNTEKSANPAEIAALQNEINRLELARTKLQQNNSPSLIFSAPSYEPAAPIETKDANEDKILALQDEIDKLTRRTDEIANRPEPAVLPEVEIEEPLEEPVVDLNQEKRARLINQAILQGTVQTWNDEHWIAVIEPTASMNFEVGDELALRRNGGILCNFYVSSSAGGQYIADLKSSLAQGAPDIVVGDELIIPLVYDGEMD